MALSIKNDSPQPRWITYTVDGQPKRAYFKGYEERIIDEIDSVDSLSSKRASALRQAISSNPNSLNAALIIKKGGFIRDTSQEDRFEGFVSFANNKFSNFTLNQYRNSTPLSLFRTSTDRPQDAGTQFFNPTTKKLENISGFYSVGTDYIVNLSKGKVVYGFDFNPSLSKTDLASNFAALFRRNNLRGVTLDEIGIALMNASSTGSTGTTGTTVIVTGETGTTWVTGSTTGVTSGTTTGTTGTTATITGSTSGTCFTTVDVLQFLTCYGAPTSGSTSGCTLWDFNGNGSVDTGDLLTLLSNFCTSGTTG